MINEQTQKLAERIALLLQDNESATSGGGNDDDFSLVRESLEKINERLDKIESRLSPSAHHASHVSHPPFHYSQEKFENLEDFSHQTANSSSNEKACPFEPTGKPCDHCAMCSARGF